jgi:hypothetical protein
MLHKLRAAMGTRDSRYEVSGMVEVDEGFFSTGVPEGDKDKQASEARQGQPEEDQGTRHGPDRGWHADKEIRQTYIRQIHQDDCH